MAATISDITPAYGSDIGPDEESARWTPITFTISVDSDHLPIVYASEGATPAEVRTVYDGAAFTPGFEDHGTVDETSSDVYAFSILPLGGWQDAPTIDVGQTDGSGTMSWTLPDADFVPATPLTDLQRLTGRDILFADGDIQVGDSGDYVLVDGLANIRRSIERRLMTLPGEYALRPEWGIGAEDRVKKTMSQAALAELKNRIVEQLLQDRRITEVSDVVFTKNDNELRVEIQAVAQDGELTGVYEVILK